MTHIFASYDGEDLGELTRGTAGWVDEWELRDPVPLTDEDDPVVLFHSFIHRCDFFVRLSNLKHDPLPKPKGDGFSFSIDGLEIIPNGGTRQGLTDLTR